MYLLEISRGHVVIEVNGKTIIIYCEALLRGHGSPDFIIYKDTMTNLDPPHESELISGSTRAEILGFLCGGFKKMNITVEFE